MRCNLLTLHSSFLENHPENILCHFKNRFEVLFIFKSCFPICINIKIVKNKSVYFFVIWETLRSPPHFMNSQNCISVLFLNLHISFTLEEIPSHFEHSVARLIQLTLFDLSDGLTYLSIPVVSKTISKSI